MGAVIESDFKSLDQYLEPLSSFENFVKTLVPHPFHQWSTNTDGIIAPELNSKFEALFTWRQAFYNEFLSFRHWIKRSVEVAKKYQVNIEGLWEAYIPKIISITFALIQYV